MIPESHRPQLRPAKVNVIFHNSLLHGNHTYSNNLLKLIQNNQKKLFHRKFLKRKK